MSIITYFENHNPLRRPLNQPRRWPPNQPRRRSGRRSRQNGAVDMRHLDSVLQDLGFAPKPHPTIFTENEPDALFDGLEKFLAREGMTARDVGGLMHGTTIGLNAIIQRRGARIGRV